MTKDWETLEALMKDIPEAQAEAMNLTLRDMTDLARLRSMEPWSAPRYTADDIGNSDLYADFYRDTMRYVPERKCWYIYEGGIWQPDTGAQTAGQNAKRLVRLLLLLLAEIPDAGAQQDAYRRVMRMHLRTVRDGILRDAQTVYTARMSDFDSDPYLLNCLNGTLDLRSRTFHEHRAQDMLTQMAQVRYNPLAASPRWESFAAEVMSDGTEAQLSMDSPEDDTAAKVRYLQKALGYALTGDTRYECLFLLYGETTRNGKGTLAESFLGMLGSYARTARPETLMLSQSSGSAPSEDVARLCGARFVSMSEPERGLRLSAALVKRLTGGDTVNARFLHENSFDFKPQFKLFINTNHLPQVADPTLFQSGRVKVIRFDRHFDADQQDRNLKSFFARSEERSGILNWCLEGLSLLGEEGLQEPECIRRAAESYRTESDLTGQFMEECLRYQPGARQRTRDIYRRYRRWCAENGYEPDNVADFRKAIGQKAQIRKMRPSGGGASTIVLMDYLLTEE